MTFLADARLPAETWERYGRVSPTGWDTDSRRAGVVRGAAQWDSRLAAAAAELEARYAEDPPAWLPERLATHRRAPRLRRRSRCAAAKPPRARELAGAPRLAASAADHVRRRRRRSRSMRSMAWRRSTRSRTRCRSSASARRSPPPSTGCAPPTSSTPGPARSASAAWRCSTPTRCATWDSRPWWSSGIAERRFPPPPRQDALLLDHERAELNTRWGWSLPLRAAGGDPEPLQFAVAHRRGRPGASAQRPAHAGRRDAAGAAVDVPAGRGRAGRGPPGAGGRLRAGGRTSTGGGVRAGRLTASHGRRRADRGGLRARAAGGRIGARRGAPAPTAAPIRSRARRRGRALDARVRPARRRADGRRAPRSSMGTPRSRARSRRPPSRRTRSARNDSS